MSASRRGSTPSSPTGSQVRGSDVMEGKPDRLADLDGDPPTEPWAKRPDPDLGEQVVAARRWASPATVDSHSAGASSITCSTCLAGRGSSM